MCGAFHPLDFIERFTLKCIITHDYNKAWRDYFLSHASFSFHRFWVSERLGASYRVNIYFMFLAKYTAAWKKLLFFVLDWLMHCSGYTACTFQFLSCVCVFEPVCLSIMIYNVFIRAPISVQCGSEIIVWLFLINHLIKQKLSAMYKCL